MYNVEDDNENMSPGSPAVEEKDGSNGSLKKSVFPWRVYSAHVLSTWGDNMWWFAGGCYMLELHNQSLRLTAIYGLVIAASVIVFGSTVGRWIDRTRRLTAARVFLTIQNTAVSLCAVLLAGFITYRSELEAEPGSWVTVLVSSGGIFLASVARLASSGTNIIIQKDWVVVIAKGDTDLLAKMNSILRTIELITYMVAPAVAGQLFTFLGFGFTGIFIALWNIVSVMLEYLLLHLIYNKYPALANKKLSESEQEVEEECKPSLSPDTPSSPSKDSPSPSLLAEAWEGWALYARQPVMKAGLGLALLFMTVLGFDNITYGFCLMQGVPHAVLGVLVGVSALVGVAGSLAYPVVRKAVGIERTGLLGMFLLISCSSLAVISPFLPGSPMDLSVLTSSSTLDNQTVHTETPINKTQMSLSELSELSELAHEVTWEAQTVDWKDPEFWTNHSSVILFLAGIIFARFGLWIVDLTVNQLLQEKVDEDVRGVVNGVQDSLNNALDLAKCVLVILLPAAETFALLIFASFVSINLGWLMYALYSRGQRGHLFHFCRLAEVFHPPETPKGARKDDAEDDLKEPLHV